MDIQKAIKGMVRKIAEEYEPERIILFGSFAWGKPSASSDVDLLVVKNSSLAKRFRATEVEKILDVPALPVDILVRTPEEIETRKKMGDPFINLILRKGKVLYAAK